MGKRLNTALFCLLIVVVCLALGACAVFNQPRFGKRPKGDRLEIITQSPNYKDGEFQYPIPTPQFSQDVSLFSVIWDGFYTFVRWGSVHIFEIGEAFHGFDLALLDCGQYDPRWSYIHMTPEEAAQAARDLGARALIPAHVGRFTIANHPWDEPFKRLTEASQDKSYQLLTPKIGEPVMQGDTFSQFYSWWTDIR